MILLFFFVFVSLGSKSSVSTRSQREPLTPYDPELNRILRRMENQCVLANPNKGNLGDGESRQPPLPVEANHQAHVENQLGDALWVQPPAAP